MLDGTAVPRWIETVLEQLQAAPFVDLRLFVLNGEQLPPRTLRQRERHMRHRLAYAVYETVDSRLYGSEDDALAVRELGPQFDGVRRMSVVPTRPKSFEHRFSDEDVEAIKAEELDVMLRFGFAIIRGGILDVARYGVWSFHHDDNREYRGGPPFFWEMAEGNPVTGVVLQILSDELDGGKVIYRSLSATDQSSLRRGRASAYAKGSHFVIRRLRELHEGGWAALEALETFDEPSTYDKPIYKTPNNRRTAAFAARVWGGIGARALARAAGVREEWHVGWRRRAPGDASPVDRLAGGAPFTFLEQPPGRWLADPFLLERDGRAFVFLEDFDVETGRARISAVELRDGAPAGAPAPVLEKPYHLSYPFVFEHDGEVFMVPESAAGRVVELYRAVELPHRWERVRVLMDDVEAYDTTLLRRDGRWWMFTTIAMPGGPSVDELFVFHAESLDGEWTPHPRNPVVSDVRCARPAGRLVEHDGRLIRPGQDCSVRYGRAIVWREITALDDERYEERTIGRFEADRLGAGLATHTYDASPSFEVVDVLRRGRRRS